MDYYELINKKPVLIGGVEEFVARADRSFANRIKKSYYGDIYISTVFLTFDHGYGRGEPILFETMVFGGKLDQEMDRYTTYKAAVKGHKFMVYRVMKADGPLNISIIYKTIMNIVGKKIYYFLKNKRLWRERV